MNGYYSDPEKITFDRAEDLVERYVHEHQDVRTRVTCKEVAQAYEVATSHHNLIRINDALDRRLETARPAGAKATQYRLP